ncbi:metallophosphoesterase [Bradyrhizobium sp. 38]|uniref:metallophosphoesterase n=1 Tax=unclassified Bradyrhizobium TaxID=2631580 RepID=UPI001FF8016A|nr:MULTISPECIES: metallophosphoesterase [unclassified Bradyrhizobium]MCK1341013.1 metallophosphoesterase [Bradyrhizobium sp. 38]MCK1780978.1 metallophosphoesterase [Bradyrhizobium sp. 132]
MSTFLTADPHFFHEGIIKLCGRPFANAHEMNDAMRAAWNGVVKASDDVIVVGDFAHRAGDPKALRALFDSLAGRKHLVIGNHDVPALLPWASTHEALHTSIDNVAVTLCHYAWRVWPRQRRGAVMLYGHNHGRLPGNRQSCDIGVDVLGWAPVRMSRIKQHLATLLPLADPEADLDGGLTP